MKENSMFRNMKYQPQKLFKLKVFFAVLALILFLVQIIGVVSYLRDSTHEFKTITKSDLDRLSEFEYVQGIINRDDIILHYEDQGADSLVLCVGVLSEGNKMVLLTSVNESAPESSKKLSGLIYGDEAAFSFRGKVGNLKSEGLTSMRVNMTLQNDFHDHKLTDDDISKLTIRLTDPDDSYTIKLIVAASAGAIMMLVVFFLLMKKSINNLIYGILVQKGVIKPEIKVKKEDIIFDSEGTYSDEGLEGGTFYVNSDIPEDRVSGGDKEYHFDRTGAGTADFPAGSDAALPEERKMRASDMDYYQSGTNEDGNFYVDKSTDKSVHNNDSGDYFRY